MLSSASSGLKRGGVSHARSTRSSSIWSVTVSRRSPTIGGVTTAGRATSGPRRNEPKYLLTSRFAVAVSKSPTMVSVALFGR